MKRQLFLAIFCLFLLSACQQDEEDLPDPFPSTFSLKEGVEFGTNLKTYEEIVALIELMVMEDVMEIRVPYTVNLLEEDLFFSYEFAYKYAYQNVNARFIEYTCNTSRYSVGYSIDETGRFHMILSRDDGEYSLEEILAQNQYYREQITVLTAELYDSGRLSDDLDEMGRIKVVYDFVLEYLEYDYDYKPISFTAYGAVTEQSVVCQGYVALFNSLLRELGFHVEGVIGTAFHNSEAHIWSKVKIGETWHFFDPTFGDRPTFSPEEGDLPYNYTYFDIEEDLLMRDRTTTNYLVNNATLVF